MPQPIVFYEFYDSAANHKPISFGGFATADSHSAVRTTKLPNHKKGDTKKC